MFGEFDVLIVIGFKKNAQGLYLLLVYRCEQPFRPQHQNSKHNQIADNVFHFRQISGSERFSNANNQAANQRTRQRAKTSNHGRGKRLNAEKPVERVN